MARAPSPAREARALPGLLAIPPGPTAENQADARYAHIVDILKRRVILGIGRRREARVKILLDVQRRR